MCEISVCLVKLIISIFIQAPLTQHWKVKKSRKTVSAKFVSMGKLYGAFFTSAIYEHCDRILQSQSDTLHSIVLYQNIRKRFALVEPARYPAQRCKPNPKKISIKTSAGLVSFLVVKVIIIGDGVHFDNRNGLDELSAPKPFLLQLPSFIIFTIFFSCQTQYQHMSNITILSFSLSGTDKLFNSYRGPIFTLSLFCLACDRWPTMQLLRQCAISLPYSCLMRKHCPIKAGTVMSEHLQAMYSRVAHRYRHLKQNVDYVNRGNNC